MTFGAPARCELMFTPRVTIEPVGTLGTQASHPGAFPEIGAAAFIANPGGWIRHRAGR
jgi:hypothetical protein